MQINEPKISKAWHKYPSYINQARDSVLSKLAELEGFVKETNLTSFEKAIAELEPLVNQFNAYPQSPQEVKDFYTARLRHYEEIWLKQADDYEQVQKLQAEANRTEAQKQLKAHQEELSQKEQLLKSYQEKSKEFDTYFSQKNYERSSEILVEIEKINADLHRNSQIADKDKKTISDQIQKNKKELETRLMNKRTSQLGQAAAPAVKRKEPNVQLEINRLSSLYNKALDDFSKITSLSIDVKENLIAIKEYLDKLCTNLQGILKEVKANPRKPLTLTPEIIFIREYLELEVKNTKQFISLVQATSQLVFPNDWDRYNEAKDQILGRLEATSDSQANFNQKLTEGRDKEFARFFSLRKIGDTVATFRKLIENNLTKSKNNVLKEIWQNKIFEFMKQRQTDPEVIKKVFTFMAALQARNNRFLGEVNPHRNELTSEILSNVIKENNKDNKFQIELLDQLKANEFANAEESKEIIEFLEKKIQYNTALTKYFQVIKDHVVEKLKIKDMDQLQRDLKKADLDIEAYLKITGNDAIVRWSNITNKKAINLFMIQMKTLISEELAINE